ncbi:MAG: extracellular solute-binding protein [Methylobacterium mesophilicum]|nr:extracellular solute-binding protein [Methylobacterium mesophilicum]
MSVRLKGMTWNHARGYDPMVACSALWKEKTGVEITWEKRPLQDFESFPVDELARLYDLIVIDHPHVGQVTAENCLLPLDVEGREAQRDALAKGSVGQSYGSYIWAGRQWGFPIDAATQVQAIRPDLIDGPVKTFAEAVALGRDGRLALPLRSPHVLMVFYTLAANMGSPCRTDAAPLIDEACGAKVWRLMRELAAVVDPVDFGSDPIAVFERMAEKNSRIACTPLAYGYVPYAFDGFRAARLRFTDIPSVDGAGPVGAALGGTGIAVSARTAHPAEATDFAYWIASADVQRGPFSENGGQPGHAAAWEDEAVNRRTDDFFSGTRATLEGSFLRPRHDGYMAFQALASDRLLAGLRKGEAAGPVVADLNRLFGESFE